MLTRDLSPQLKSYIFDFINRQNYIFFESHGILFKLEIGPGGEFILSSNETLIDTLLLDENEIEEAVINYVRDKKMQDVVNK